MIEPRVVYVALGYIILLVTNWHVAATVLGLHLIMVGTYTFGLDNNDENWQATLRSTQYLRHEVCVPNAVWSISRHGGLDDHGHSGPSPTPESRRRLRTLLQEASKVGDDDDP
jgi:hypothetical protein